MGLELGSYVARMVVGWAGVSAASGAGGEMHPYIRIIYHIDDKKHKYTHIR